MARTWGQLRFEISKFAAGIDLQLVNEWLNSAYREVLDHHSWKGLEKDAVLETVAPYTTGTVTVTNGSTALTGAATVWTAGMTGRQFRIVGDSSFYTFTRTAATTGTLDRAYEGTTAAGAAYSIFQAIYSLPSDVKYIQQMLNPRTGQPIELKDRAAFGRMAPSLTYYGEPSFYIPVSDSDELTPPVLHEIELYPVPNQAAGYPYSYQKAVVQFDGTNTSSSPLPWVSEDAIVSGAIARVLRHQKDYTGFAAAKADALTFRVQMFTQEQRRVGPQVIVMADRYTRHRRARWQR